MVKVKIATKPSTAILSNTFRERFRLGGILVPHDRLAHVKSKSQEMSQNALQTSAHTSISVTSVKAWKTMLKTSKNNWKCKSLNTEVSGRDNMLYPLRRNNWWKPRWRQYRSRWSRDSWRRSADLGLLERGDAAFRPHFSNNRSLTILKTAKKWPKILL